MKGTGRSAVVAACGLVTSIITALLVARLSQSWHVALYTLSFWIVIPVGAIATGFVASSGYYFGSIVLNRRPDLSLLLQVLVIAGLTQWLIYRFSYAHARLDDGTPVSSVLSFNDYLSLTLTSAHHVMSKYASVQVDTGALGSAGYGFAALYFIGFLLGGAILWTMLRRKPFCSDCDRFLDVQARRARIFADPKEAATHYHGLFMHKMGTPAFTEALRAEPSPGLPRRGALNVVTLLYNCPTCRAQQLEQQISAYDGRRWESSRELSRRIGVPAGVNLAPAFRPLPPKREPQRP